MTDKLWVCGVCGYSVKGLNPPKQCPQCSSGAEEFYLKNKKVKLSFDNKPFDVLLINGSSHKNHNTGLLLNYAESELKRQRINYKRLDLNQLEIQHCWCCYSIKDSACTYPCRNQLDDASIIHEMLIKSKAVIIASPINWNNLSARLKDFLDRLTSIENRGLLGAPSLTAGKVCGILVNGHEDGGIKTAFDIFIYFQQMGFVLAPFGIMYRTHGAGNNTKSDYSFFSKDEKIKKDVKSVVNNVIKTIKLNPEQFKEEFMQVCE